MQVAERGGVMNKKILQGVYIGIIVLLAVACISSPSFAALQYEQAYASSGGTYKILIVVKDSLYSSIQSSLNQYYADLESEQYNITTIKYISGTAEELKAHLKSINNLEGVVFIGDLPYATFEIAQDFTYGYTSFPIDLFYMDLTGEWLDTDNNGKYDTHNKGNGYLVPDIWLARLTASTVIYVDMDEAALLRNYFAKNHSFRNGQLPIQKRALAYPDDDWSGSGNCSLNLAYANVTTINDQATTNATDYKNRLRENYEWVHVCVHSSSASHVFSIPTGSGGSVVYSDIKTLDPTVLFYNLFACSNCRYTSSNYMGGHYIFARTYGLAAVGSTKTGSMLSFNKFYEPLGPVYKNNLGEAFRAWFSSQDLSNASNRSWFYGMTLLGDPTLRLYPKTGTDVIGDLNSDGSVTSADVTRCVNSIVRLETNPYIIKKADVNNDGAADARDVTRIINIILP